MTALSTITQLASIPLPVACVSFLNGLVCIGTTQGTLPDPWLKRRHRQTRPVYSGLTNASNCTIDEAPGFSSDDYVPAFVSLVTLPTSARDTPLETKFLRRWRRSTLRDLGSTSASSRLWRKHDRTTTQHTVASFHLSIFDDTSPTTREVIDHIRQLLLTSDQRCHDVVTERCSSSRGRQCRHSKHLQASGGIPIHVCIGPTRQWTKTRMPSKTTTCR